MKKILALIILAFSLSASAQKNHNYDVARNLEIFSAIYKNLNMMYVDTLDASEVIRNTMHLMR